MKRYLGLILGLVLLIAACTVTGEEDGAPSFVLTGEETTTRTPFQPQTATLTLHPTVTARPTLTPSPTPNEVGCQEKQGKVIEGQMGAIAGFDTPLEFTLYLPPCYEENVPRNGYPLLTLIHGQTYTPQQWIEIGLPEKMDQLINSGNIEPYVVVMPYESLAYSGGLQAAIVGGLIPYLQQEYLLCSGRVLQCHRWYLSGWWVGVDGSISIQISLFPSGCTAFPQRQATLKSFVILPRQWGWKIFPVFPSILGCPITGTPVKKIWWIPLTRVVWRMISV